ncbi:tRNA (5-methylaminomethyl-2-thiouridine)(34)-methyltransferase MnmD, partial [Paracidovorax cattleyae]
MSEPIDWLPDGTPFNPRFGDRYHSETGLAQAREVFLHGCGLPQAWAGQAQWRVLETGFGFGLNFITTWAAWRADPARPRLLHFVSCEAFPVSADDLLRSLQGHGELELLARALHARYWGLLPGVHRLAFEGGQVLLTLYIGDAQAMLRQQQPVADAVYLDGFSPQVNPGLWEMHTLKAVARCCRRGTRLATWSVAGAVRDGLAQCGFQVHKVPGLPPKRANLQAVFDPAWEPRPAQAELSDVRVPGGPSGVLVIGGGLSGAAVAASLARRGWQVRVL